MTQADVTNKYLGKILGKLNHLDPDILTRIVTALEGIEKKMGDEDCDDCLNPDPECECPDCSDTGILCGSCEEGREVAEGNTK